MQKKYAAIEETEETSEPSVKERLVETILAEKKERKYSQASDAAREALLDMGTAWEDARELNQAVITYKDLIELAPDTPEAETAKEGLLRIAKAYQKEGARYTAISLYKYVMDR
jgi:tetratricopeptide (TPR) repeat protein